MSRNAAAARAVAFHVEDPGERLELMNMLGLIDDAGRIAPDDERLISMEQLNTEGGKVKMRETAEWFLDKPETSTAPEALRVLPPIPVEPKVKAPRVRKPRDPNSPTKPRPSRAKGTQKTRPPSGTRCGTRLGWEDHYAYGEKACKPCLAAKAAVRLAKRRARILAETGVMPEDRKPAQCGEKSGARAHRRRGEKPCEPCRVAHNADSVRKRAEAKRKKAHQ